MESRVKVRMENRKVMDTKQGSGKHKWNKGGQGSEFQYGVAWSVTSTNTLKCCKTSFFSFRNVMLMSQGVSSMNVTKYS